MDISNKDLKRRIIEISYKKGLSHLGSCLTAVDIIKEVYDIKKPNEKFVLSSGHAGLALYCVLESFGGRNAEEIFDHHGVHPDRCSECGIDCSSGSLGHGLPIALGMALVNRDRVSYCLISDGECSEGSVWEALRIAREQYLTNLKIYFNFNNFSAYKEVDSHFIEWQIRKYLETSGPLSEGNPTLEFRYTTADYLPFLKGQIGHYKVMSEKEYIYAKNILR